MKTLKITTGICVLALVFSSCEGGKRENAKQHVQDYITYVDSISNLDLAVASSNWNTIENKYENHKSSATDNLMTISENESLKMDIKKSTDEFEAYKAKVVEEEKLKNEMTSKNNFRKSLLGENYVHDDMTFEWINKDNILNVYQNFVDTVDANKDSYSREDWDEIKLLYEAIDTRKNTVEKEGLSSTDNRKIAALKVKFAPLYTINRVSAKSEENANAKK
tara:strand:- start:20134 stop:20796 length:663 start_codon:yes stop_codon:yes gene_type:complete